MALTPALSPDVLAVLAAAAVDGRDVRLTSGQLERALYEEVNDVLVRLGGKWQKGKAQVHRFAHYDPAPLLAGVIASGVMPPKNPTAFFPTPAPLVAQMLDEARLTGYADMDAALRAFILQENGGPIRVLEPSAGTGGIADAVRAISPLLHVDCVEVLPVNAAVLRAKGHTVFEQDFLSFRPNAPYTACVMNPPFSIGGVDRTAYITHIKHAWSMLAEGGRLVAVIPRVLDARETAAIATFREFVYEYGESFDVEAGAFSESGTNVATTVITLEKRAVTRVPRQGFHCQHCWEASLIAENNRDFDARIERLFASQPAESVPRNGDSLAPALAAQIDDHFRAVVREDRLHVVLRPECFRTLRRYAVMDRHGPEMASEAGPVAAVTAAAGPVIEAETGTPAPARVVQASFFDDLAA